MKILFGIVLIAMGLMTAFAAAWVYERARSAKLREKNGRLYNDVFDLAKQLREERTYSDVLKAELDNTELIGKAFADWKRVEDVEGIRQFYLEKDNIRIIIENGKACGYYVYTSKEKAKEYVAPRASKIDRLSDGTYISHFGNA